MYYLFASDDSSCGLFSNLIFDKFIHAFSEFDKISGQYVARNESRPQSMFS